MCTDIYRNFDENTKSIQTKKQTNKKIKNKKNKNSFNNNHEENTDENFLFQRTDLFLSCGNDEVGGSLTRWPDGEDVHR